MKFPGLDLPDLPDCSELIKSGANLMDVVAEQLPRAVDALVVIANARDREVNGER